ncbi:AraC family transcriptional regulator [Elizabethkingia anophelis]|nr:AraC family transcriptional regulator [Elizabethkingia anophelis]MCT3951270.1 AraC family transcriptional regulator [Elizabethkingia anophelis]MCT3954813.1 AraC family transcriptional regulator [Elizabethkingia anophelis]MCT3986761.1 AraC family transcriptional regulator [Elizabethkingia anophelis]MCT4064944.1 AraC family transcriptional regulator [Elizabethkingia anophelis]
MAAQIPVQIKTISEYHRKLGLPKPEHSLVSLIKFEDIPYNPEQAPKTIIHNFYSIALKKTFYAKLKYGQQEVDFDEGTLLFMAPMQVLSIEGPQEPLQHEGWLLLVHPDLLWNTHLAKTIRRYEFFDYKANEALHVSEHEEKMIVGIMQNIMQETRSGIDHYSQNIMVAQLELLLSYAERFYQRQFITRKVSSHEMISRLEELLSNYCNSGKLQQNGIPTVTYFSDALHLSANYLSRLLKTLTGLSTKQYIQDKIIELAKEKLSTTELSVNEIAYELGFEHPQSFSKLFKAKTNYSPNGFRQSFN